MKMLLEIIKQYKEAKKARLEQIKQERALLKDNLRVSYFQAAVDKIGDEKGVNLKVTLSLNNGQDVIIIERSKTQPNGHKSFWDKYQEVQAAKGYTN